MYRKYLKALFDTLTATFAFLLLFPFFLLVVVLLLLFNDGHVFFFQPRPGLNSRIFKVIKFKTMNDRRDKSGQLLPDAERLTGLGRFIRRTSLDEIPQLLNVIKGDMSLVGPRPLLVEYLPLYNETQRRRHEVKPGITGWAQVNGRNAISWNQKFAYDVYYVDNVSFKMDIKIILLTVKKVFISEGINSATSATMEKFTGEGV
ncbi:sugar transferase [Mucilaginibacter sp. L3T2-6]|uniref:sugar transferase n=1 Tax=Mucilaginibacter sp. L3T2-6 TaxID=3062491 RepID=UPI0026769C9F|nr:sugar transferase [Mucilaginibacter sp. L3T2-6]MDO3642987.1 sugar transferase [Mucilaginibacter sp. L3T2-6]MDV6215312.1 sugar transferase [Mucilaginibacter sp. L3T2-6]